MISDHQQLTSQLVFHPRLADGERERLIALFSQPAPAANPGFSLKRPMQPDISASQYEQALELARELQQQSNWQQRATSWVNYIQAQSEDLSKKSA